MRYAEWRSHYVTATDSDAARSAQLWNLEHESRVSDRCGLFKRRIASFYEKHVGANESPGDAAIHALDDARKLCAPLESPWLGLFQYPKTAQLPSNSFSCLPLSLTELARDHSRSFVDPLGAPLRTVQLDRPLKSETGPGGRPIPRSRFIWITFVTGGRTFPNTPEAVVRELGLAHYTPGPNQYFYRCSVEATEDATYIPTCFDAGLYEAWAPPPPGHADPWGMTRDLTSGEPCWPELLTETERHWHERPTAKLVSPPDHAIPFDHPVQCNFMVNR